MKIPLLQRKGGGITLAEALDKYELLDVEHGGPSGSSYLVMSDPNLPVDRTYKLAVPSTKNPAKYSQGPDLRELGTTGQTAYGGTRQEYVPELRGHQAYRTYDKMKRSDARVRASLRVVKMPVTGARWFIEPASKSVRDKNVADFVWENLECWMSTSFPQMLWEALLMLDYGYYMFEKVFDFGENTQGGPKGKIVWKKLAPRHPADVYEWELDKNGGPQAVWMQSGGPQPVRIDIDKLLIFTFDKEAGNLEGMSILRSAYKHWFYKSQLEKIDAIQKERHGIGIPIIKLPPNFDDKDKLIANELGRNLRTNESAHVVLPPNWEIEFAKIQGQPVSCLDSIEHHDRLLMTNILAEFLHAKTNVSGQAGTVFSDIFVKSTRYMADIVADVINKYAIPQLVDYNWNKVGYPKLKARRIGDTVDWRTISFAIRNFVGAGIIQPDDPLEEWIRNEMDLPQMDPDTTREVATPQQPGAGAPAEKETSDAKKEGKQPGQASPPRQSTAAGMKKGAGGKNVGTDKSGG